MIRRKVIAGAVALATATAIATSGTATAQEVGTPEKIGYMPSSSELFMEGVHGLSSANPAERQAAPEKFYFSLLAAGYHGILVPLDALLSSRPL